MESKGFFDRTYEYIFRLTLTADQDLLTQVAINVDADFWLAAFYCSQSEGDFEFLITDSDGYELSNAPLPIAGASTTAGIPQIISPPHRFPAGGKIQLRLRNLTSDPNLMQLNFKGWKRFQNPVPASA